MKPTEYVAAPAAGPLGRWAEVHAAEHVTRYLRFGPRGGVVAEAPVILLVPRNPEASIWPELFDWLASRTRVYMPDLAEGEELFVARLRSFLDGVGLSHATLIAPGSFCVAAMEFALLEPDRIHGLILIPSGAGGTTGVIGSLTTTTSTALAPAIAPARRVPMLVIRRSSPAADALTCVTEFVT